MKAQVVVNKADKEIICVSESFGKTHDFKIYKGTIGKHILSKIKIQADSGYQGICTCHQNSETPKKKPKGRELSAEEKSENKRISHERIFIEHINTKIKTFKIVLIKSKTFLLLYLLFFIISFPHKNIVLIS